MPGTDLTEFDAVLKEDYLGAIREQMNTSTVLMSRLDKNEEDVGGKEAVVPLHTGRNSGIGARAENGNLPTAGKQGYKDAKYNCAYNYATIQIPGPTIKASRNNKYAFVRAVESELDGALTDLKDEINIQMHGNGTGVIAKVNGDPTTATLTVADPGTLYCQTGMLIDIVDPSSTTAGDARATATGLLVDEKASATTLTMDATLDAAVADGDYVVRSGNYRLAMMGLRGIVSDANPGTGLYVGGIDRATAGNSFWKAHILANGGTARDLSLDLMQEAFDAVEEDGGKVSLILTSYFQRRKYLALVKEDGRFVNTLKMDGGFTALDYNGKPLVVDRHCYPGSIKFLDESTLAVYRMSDFDWMQEDGAILSRVTGKDAYAAVLCYYATLGCSACNRNADLTDLKVA